MRQMFAARARPRVVALLALAILGLRRPAAAEERAQAEHATPDEGCKPPIRAYELGKGPGGLDKLPPERMLSERPLGAEPLTAGKRKLLEKVDGNVLALPEGEADTRRYLLEFENLGKNCVVWSRLEYSGRRIKYWNGKVWMPCRLPTGTRDYDRAGLLKELRWLVDLPESQKSLWLLVGADAKTDSVGNKKAATGESTKETLLEQGPPENALFLAAWREESPDSLLLLADSPAGDRVLRRPFRSGKLLLVATCGHRERTVELEIPGYVRNTDVGPEGADPLGSKSPLIHRFSTDSIRMDLEVTGNCKLIFRYTQAEDDESRRSGAWSGTVQSNPIVLKFLGRIKASEAEDIGRGAPRVKVPVDPESVSKTPKEGIYTSGNWRYEINYEAKHSKSEGVRGRLYLGERAVLPLVKGEKIQTPFGVLQHVSSPPERNFLGELVYGRKYGRQGWFPPSPPNLGR